MRPRARGLDRRRRGAASTVGGRFGGVGGHGLQSHGFGDGLDRRGRRLTRRPLDRRRRHRRGRALHLHRAGDHRAAVALFRGEQRRERVDQLGRLAGLVGLRGPASAATGAGRGTIIVSASPERSAAWPGGPAMAARSPAGSGAVDRPAVASASSRRRK